MSDLQNKSIVGWIGINESNKSVGGWIADKDHPDEQQYIEILINDVVIHECVANQPRQHLNEKGHGKGNYGFSYPIPEQFFSINIWSIKCWLKSDNSLVINGDDTRVFNRDTFISDTDSGIVEKGIRPNGFPGVSIVTCAMNRTDNLLKSLPTWLFHNEIDEIVIVDWSSDESVSEAVREKGIKDSRIKIVRVESEPRWILSVAFNLGFRLSKHSHILKVDADVQISKGFFNDNTLLIDNFIAGNWRTAPKDQEFINGFFLVSRKALSGVNGFNEYITTYGWDDEDLFNRLQMNGCSRRDVAPGSINHLDHDDDKRWDVDYESNRERSARAALKGSNYLIRANKYISNIMPEWSNNQTLAPFEWKTCEGKGSFVERQSRQTNKAPEHIVKLSNLLSYTDLISWKFGLRVKDITLDRIDILLNKPIVDISEIDIELAIKSNIYDSQILIYNKFIIVDIGDGSAVNREIYKKLMKMIGDIASKWDRLVLLTGSIDGDELNNLELEYIYIEDRHNIGPVGKLDLSDLVGSNPEGKVLNIDLRLNALEEIDKLFNAIKRNPISTNDRSTIYIDAQHGLGNRLRAIASAAAIAESTNRELAIIWQPDIHCDCLFSDLFEYDGNIINRITDIENFAKLHKFNYMSIEEGAIKNAFIPDIGDLYIKSAYTLNHPSTDWQSENEFLRSLKPTKNVENLLTPFPNEFDLSVHVRMEGGKGLDHNIYDDKSNWADEDHNLIHKWRAKSHYAVFIDFIEKYFRENGECNFFLAADTPETYSIFRQRYSDKVITLERESFDRSKAQLSYALADILLLARAKVLFGSNWSSFSEAAVRMANPNIRVMMSGVDF